MIAVLRLALATCGQKAQHKIVCCKKRSADMCYHFTGESVEQRAYGYDQTDLLPSVACTLTAEALSRPLLASPVTLALLVLIVHLCSKGLIYHIYVCLLYHRKEEDLLVGSSDRYATWLR